MKALDIGFWYFVLVAWVGTLNNRIMEELCEGWRSKAEEVQAQEVGSYEDRSKWPQRWLLPIVNLDWEPPHYLTSGPVCGSVSWEV